MSSVICLWQPKRLRQRGARLIDLMLYSSCPPCLRQRLPPRRRQLPALRRRLLNRRGQLPTLRRRLLPRRQQLPALRRHLLPKQWQLLNRHLITLP